MAETKKQETVQDAQPPVNFNKEYREIKLDVETAMKNIKGGGQEVNYHLCEFGKEIKTVKIEPFRAENLNRAFESRKRIYWPTDKAVPKAIKRIATTDEDGNAVWKDEVIAA